MSHFGDPCIHCDVAHDDVAPGPCPGAEGSLTRLVADIQTAAAALSAYEKEWHAEAARQRTALVGLHNRLNQAQEGLDADKIARAGNVLTVRGSYAKAGQDRAGVIRDAIQWLATGKSAAYRGLDCELYGTKNYEGWSGQRCDCEPGMGPRHGSICFQIGLKDRARKLTPTETEEAIYYLVNIERIQSAAAAANASVAA